MSNRERLDGFRWSAVGSFPPTVGSAGCELDEGRALVGGGNAGGQLLRTTYVFDANTETFLRGPDLLVPRYGHRFLLGRSGRVLAVGGSAKHWIKSPDPPFHRVYEASIPAEYLDPGKAAWEPAESLGIPCLNWCACAHLDEEVVLVAGGLVDERATSRAWVVSLSSLTVIDELEMPRARHNDDAVYLPGPTQVVVAGGEASGRFEVLERARNQWLDTPEFAEHRAEFRLVRANNGEALAIGGGFPPSDVDDVVLRWSGTSWVREPPPALPIGRRATVTEITPGTFLVLGTTGPDQNESTAQVYDDASRVWSPISAPREPRWGHTSIPVGRKRILVFGGADCRTAELGKPD